MTRKEVRRIRTIKAAIAVAYIIIGIVIAFASLGGVAFLWFSGEFLVGISVTSLNWWIRKVLYLVAFIIAGAGTALVVKGYEYLEVRRR